MSMRTWFWRVLNLTKLSSEFHHMRNYMLTCMLNIILENNNLSVNSTLNLSHQKLLLWTLRCICSFWQLMHWNKLHSYFISIESDQAWWWFSCEATSDSCDPVDCAHQAPLSMGFSKQEHWTGLPFPLREDLPNPRTELGSPELQVDSLLTEPPGNPVQG